MEVRLLREKEITTASVEKVNITLINGRCLVELIVKQNLEEKKHLSKFSKQKQHNIPVQLLSADCTLRWFPLTVGEKRE